MSEEAPTYKFACRCTPEGAKLCDDTMAWALEFLSGDSTELNGRQTTRRFERARQLEIWAA